MKIHVISLGCNKNLVDTEVMLGHLHRAGCVVVDEPESADCLLVNTCSFLTEAVEESLDRIIELARYKREGGPRRLVVTGCLVARYGEEILAEVPEVDALVSHTDLEKVVAAVKGQNAERSSTELGTGRTPLDRARDRQDAAGQDSEDLESGIWNLEFPYRVRSHPEHRAYIKIGEGCSNRCSFCLIPSIRGEFASRSPGSVTEEMRYLVHQGVREVTLVSQDSGRFGTDTDQGSLASLIASLLTVPGEYWLRVLYVHPSRVTNGLLAAMISDPRICRYLDVPFQHVSPGVLERMGRGDAPRPTEVVRKVRAAVPGVFLRTTLMTGFPGETEEDFGRLLEFVRKGEIDHLGVFPYSREEGTPAAGMEDQVPVEISSRRAERLIEEQAGVSARRLKQLVGREMTVLAEGYDESGPFGRHQGQAPEVDGVVRLDEEVKPGRFVRVRITDSGVYDLKGEVLE